MLSKGMTLFYSIQVVNLPILCSCNVSWWGLEGIFGLVFIKLSYRLLT